MKYAEALARAFNDGAFGALEAHMLHRARRETSLGETVGRENMIAAEVRLAAALGGAAVTVKRYAGEVLRVTAPGGLRQHRWPVLEGGRVVRETLVEDVGAETLGRAAGIGRETPMQPPLGELRSGRGQLSAGATAWMQGPHQPVLDALHRIWNGRHLDELANLYAAEARWAGPGDRAGGVDALRFWLTGLIARLPDATLLFDSFAAEGDRLAILWRLFGYEAGVRVRLFGSSLLTLRDGLIVEDETLLDELALEAARHRPLQVIRR